MSTCAFAERARERTPFARMSYVPTSRAVPSLGTTPDRRVNTNYLKRGKRRLGEWGEEKPLRGGSRAQPRRSRRTSRTKIRFKKESEKATPKRPLARGEAGHPKAQPHGKQIANRKNEDSRRSRSGTPKGHLSNEVHSPGKGRNQMGQQSDAAAPRPRCPAQL